MKTKVNHYGVHWVDELIAYLEQEKSGSNALGLKEKSPFEVRLPKKHRHCNHLIALAAPVPDPSHWSFFQSMLTDELMQAMLPQPKGGGGGFYINDADDSLKLHLILLSKLSSPINPIVMPIFMLEVNQIIEELQLTNVQPLVLTGVKPVHTTKLNQVAETLAVMPRTLVLTGFDDVILPTGIKRITTNIQKRDINDLARLPWETLGAVVVRRYMRREAL